MGGPRLLIEDKQAIERMTRDGVPARAIADQIGCSARTVERWRAQANIRLGRCSDESQD